MLAINIVIILTHNNYIEVLIILVIIIIVDLAGVNGCAAVYPNVTNLLCKWHVDRLINYLFT